MEMSFSADRPGNSLIDTIRTRDRALLEGLIAERTKVKSSSPLIQRFRNRFKDRQEKPFRYFHRRESEARFRSRSLASPNFW